MTDQADRERESQVTERTKFEEMTDDVAEEQREQARRLANDPIVERDPDEDE
jgi:hypothetical protein